MLYGIAALRFPGSPAENKELLHRGLRVQGAGEFYTENPIHNVTVREAPGPRGLRRTSNCKCLQNEADANRPDSGEAQRVKCLRPILSRAAGTLGSIRRKIRATNVARQCKFEASSSVKSSKVLCILH